jgi:hypothetical protein
VGQRVFTVASRSEANRWYLLVVGENALTCNCPAHNYSDKPCAHRKVVHARLVKRARRGCGADSEQPGFLFMEELRERATGAGGMTAGPSFRCTPQGG